MEALSQLKSHWDAIVANPWSYAAVATLVALAAWGVAKFIYGERLATQKTLIEAGSAREKAQEAVIAELKTSIAATAASLDQVQGPASFEGVLTADQLEQIARVIRTRVGTVSLYQGSSSGLAGLVSAQLEAVFRKCGWTVDGGLLWGDDDAGSSVILDIPNGTHQQAGQLIATALRAARVAFDIADPREGRSDEGPTLTLSGPIAAAP